MVTRRVGEELSIIISIVRLLIRTSEADTYVKVGWLPVWRRRRRKKERPGSSSDTTEHIMEQKAHDSNTRLSSTKSKKKKKEKEAEWGWLRVAERQRRRKGKRKSAKERGTASKARGVSRGSFPDNEARCKSATRQTHTFDDEYFGFVQTKCCKYIV